MEVADRITVICIAYNHEKWIEQTLESVLLQDYYAKELIVVDNGSTDGTAEKIQDWINNSSGQLSVQAFFHKETHPYCQLFNEILANVQSNYLVDLSGDDVLY